MESSITWVGIDAHKATLAVAILREGSCKTTEMTIAHTANEIRKLVKSLVRQADGGEVRICYEAGVCGFELQRRIQSAGPVVCDVIAPSLIPHKPGERIKTDRRDARKLAELLRGGLLTAVSVPTAEQEAVRDLCRCRASIRADLHRSRHRLIKLLLRRGLVFDGGAVHWTGKHRRWLNELVFASAIDRLVFEHYWLEVQHDEARLKAIDAELEKAAALPIYKEQVGWLRCFTGIDTVIALGFLAELHGIDRFDSPRKLASYLGLVPSERSSGDSVRRGPITKTGNAYIRRTLLQGAWHYAKPPKVGRRLRQRREGQPARVIAIADEAHRRLNRRYKHFIGRDKNPNKAIVAVMRELVGFLWAALRDKECRGPKKAKSVEENKPASAKEKKANAPQKEIRGPKKAAEGRHAKEKSARVALRQG
jgi:transposase